MIIKNIYIEEIYSLEFKVKYEYNINQKSDDLIQYIISKKEFKSIITKTIWTWPNELNIQNIINENNYIIIDVRTKKEFEQGHLVDAINIPIEKLDNNIVKLDKNKDVFVYCRS